MGNHESAEKDVKRNKQEKKRAALVRRRLVAGRLSGWLAGELVWYGGLRFLVQMQFNRQLWMPTILQGITETVHEQGQVTDRHLGDLCNLFIKYLICRKGLQWMLKMQSRLSGHRWTHTSSLSHKNTHVTEHTLLVRMRKQKTSRKQLYRVA